MGRFGAVNTYQFSSKYNFDSFMGYLRNTSGWNLYEASDKLYGRLAPEINGAKFDMDWKLESSTSSSIKLRIDETQLNGRSKDADSVWEKLDALHQRCR